jgi:hypothetical protein
MKSFSDPFCRNISVVTTSIDWRFPTVFYRKSQKHVRFHSTTWSTTCLFFVKTCLRVCSQTDRKKVSKKVSDRVLEVFSNPRFRHHRNPNSAEIVRPDNTNTDNPNNAEIVGPDNTNTDNPNNAEIVTPRPLLGLDGFWDSRDLPEISPIFFDMQMRLVAHREEEAREELTQSR